MDNKWSYMDFKSLVDLILNGEINIHEPIKVYNISNSQSKNISLISQLLSYDNINNDNLMDSLSILYKHFLNKIDELKGTKPIMGMMDKINNEWNIEDKDSFKVDYPFKKTYIKDIKKLLDEYKYISDNCNSSLSESDKRRTYPIESILQDEHPSIKGLNTSIILCNQYLKDLNNNIEETVKVINTLRELDTSIYMDMSIQHKSFYFDSDDIDKIPNNIHNIFSNFVNIHTLLLKQVIQHYNNMKQLITDITEKCSIINTRKNNFQLLAVYSDPTKVKDDIMDRDYNINDNVLYNSSIVTIVGIDGRNIEIQFEDGRIINTDINSITPIPKEDEDEEDIIEGDMDIISDEDDNVLEIGNKLSDRLLSFY